MAEILVGTSGWVYPHWKGVFYPENLNQANWLEYYTRFFQTVEINNTFYNLPEKKTFRKWAEATPDEFIFTVKANRFITHIKRLKDPKDSIQRFFENASGLGKKLGSILFQLPPKWKLELGRLVEFLEVLPKNRRTVFEFRDESWLCEDVYSLLEEHSVALCFADSPFYPGPRKVTAGFVFYRMHGGRSRKAPDYSTEELWTLCNEIAEHLKANRDVFAYFNNDYRGFAVRNAIKLRDMLKEKGW